MAEDWNSHLKNVTIVSAATVISRALGYLRDIFMVAFLGISEVSDAFLFAFCLPNVFRKLFGEGALASIIIPVLSSHCAERGERSTVQLFGHIFLKLLLCLVALLLLLWGVIFLAGGCVEGGQWRMILAFSAALLPHMVFVCLAAAVAALLQVMGKFLAASAGQIAMNISTILSLLLGHFYFHRSGVELLRCLVVGVLVGGALQLLIPAVFAIAMGRPWKFDEKVPQLEARMDEIRRLFVPGIFGAVVEQIDVLIFRAIACRSASAVSLLYMASRLMELPIGVFGAAMASVFFPHMAKVSRSPENVGRMGVAFRAYFAAVLWILVPSAIGLFALNGEIVALFFVHGNFSSGDALALRPIISICCVNMIFSGIMPVIGGGFYALGDATTPAAVGVISLVTNALLSLALVGNFGASGMAIALTCASAVRVLCLSIFFSRKISPLPIFPSGDDLATILRGGVAVAAVALGVKFLLPSCCNCSRWMSDAIVVVAAVALSVAAYLIISRKFIGRIFRG
jgi:putative peptidoglycan lipid II flippase